MPKLKCQMKSSLIILSLLLFFNSSCLGQKIDSSAFLTPPLMDLPDKSGMVMVDVNSTSFIRILDGLILKDSFKIPRSLSIQNIIRLSDTAKLKQMGLNDFQKPYMIFDTRRKAKARWFIYNKVKSHLLKSGRNLPIILNNHLITPDHYSILSQLDIDAIRKISYLRVVPGRFSKKYGMPWGAIKVSTK